MAESHHRKPASAAETTAEDDRELARKLKGRPSYTLAVRGESNLSQNASQRRALSQTLFAGDLMRFLTTKVTKISEMLIQRSSMTNRRFMAAGTDDDVAVASVTHQDGKVSHGFMPVQIFPHTKRAPFH